MGPGSIVRPMDATRILDRAQDMFGTDKNCAACRDQAVQVLVTILTADTTNGGVTRLVNSIRAAAPPREDVLAAHEQVEEATDGDE